jgi:hypothetical protein
MMYGKAVVACSCNLSESNTPLSFPRLDLHRAQGDRGSIHYALRLKHTNGTINNGFSTAAFESVLINIIKKIFVVVQHYKLHNTSEEY